MKSLGWIGQPWGGGGDATQLRSELSDDDGLKLIGRVPTIAVLRLTEPKITGQRIDVVAYNDGWASQINPLGGGYFLYDQADTITEDNGVTCFVTPGGARWKRIINNGEVGIYDGGLQVTSEDQAALLQNVIYVCANSNLSIVGSRSATVYVSTGIIIPPILKARWCGMVIQQHADMVSGQVVTVARGSANSQTYRAGTPLHELRVSGKFNASFASIPDFYNVVDGVVVGGSGGQTSDMTFQGLEVRGFRRCVRLVGPSTYLNTFLECKIGIANERGYSYEATTDSGENIRVIGGSVFNCVNETFDAKGFVNESTSSTLDILFTGVSFDYNDIDGQLNHSKLALIECHSENNNNNPKWILNSTSGSAKTKFIARGGNMGRGPGVSPTAIPTEDSDGRPSFIDGIGSNIDVSVVDVDFPDYYTTARKSVVFRNVNGLTQRRINIKPLMDGSPNSGSGIPITPYAGINMLYVPGAGATTYWTLNPGSGSSVTADTTVKSGRDTGSRKVVTGGTTASGSIVQTIPVTPGLTIVAKVAVMTLGLTQGSATGRVIFYAQDNTTVISDLIFPRRVTADAVVLTDLTWYGQVPSGAYFMRFQDYWTGLPATSVSIWFSGEFAYQF